MQFMASFSLYFLGEYIEDTNQIILQRWSQFLFIKIFLSCGDVIDTMELFLQRICAVLGKYINLLKLAGTTEANYKMA